MSDAMTDRSCTIHGEYPLPRHNVVLLSCMDLRLADELASFMDRDNLTNRYDHLIAAGAALGVMRHDDIPRADLHFRPALGRAEVREVPALADHLLRPPGDRAEAAQAARRVHRRTPQLRGVPGVPE